MDERIVSQANDVKKKKSILGDTRQGSKWTVGLHTNKFRDLLKKRGIEPGTIAGLSIGFDRSTDTMAFWNGDSEKSIKFDLKTGKRTGEISQNAEFCWPQDAPRKETPIYIAEGQITALALREMGFQAYACKPEGLAAKTLQGWVNCGFDVVACYDADGAGEGLTKKAASLGVRRRVEWASDARKGYDADDLLLETGKERAREYIEAHTSEMPAPRMFEDWTTPKPSTLPAEDEAAEQFKTSTTAEDFLSHPLAKIANAFALAPTAGGLETAAALALVGSHVDVVSHLDKPEGRYAEYPARAQIFVISQAGSGKSTVIDELRRQIQSIGGESAAPKSDSAGFDIILRAGSKVISDGVDEHGKTQKRRVAIQLPDRPSPVLLALDEAGSFLNSAGNNDKCGDQESFLRQSTGGTVQIPSTKRAMENGDSLAYVPANVTSILLTTEDQYVDYVGKTRKHGDNGEERRRLVFFSEEKKDGVKDGYSVFDMESDESGAILIHEVIERYASELFHGIPKGQVFTFTNEAKTESSDAVRALLAAGITAKSSIDTLLVNYAVIVAAARCALDFSQEFTVTRADMRCLCEIFKATLGVSRPALAERIERAGDRRYKSENEVWSDIRGYIGDGKRKDRVFLYVSNKPPIYRETLEKCIKRGLYKEAPGTNKHKMLIPTTAEEQERAADALDRLEKERERVRAEKSKSVFDGNHQNEPYTQCDELEKKRRLAAYLTEHEKEHPVVVGNRDNSLRSLSTKLEAAGMKDETARMWFWDLCDSVGFTDEKDIQRVWRPLGK